MDMVKPEEIALIESDITRKMLNEFDIDLGLLVYDTTNFFTFIDTFNERCSLPQRGHSKAKRNDLRQVNLALLVSADYHIPLFHKLYEGNVTDNTSFLSITDCLVARYRALREHLEDITIVFGKGNNSKGGMAKVDESPYHFVGSLVPSHHKDLLEIPRNNENYHPIDLKRFCVQPVERPSHHHRSIRGRKDGGRNLQREALRNAAQDNIQGARKGQGQAGRD